MTNNQLVWEKIQLLKCLCVLMIKYLNSADGLITEKLQMD